MWVSDGNEEQDHSASGTEANGGTDAGFLLQELPSMVQGFTILQVGVHFYRVILYLTIIIGGC